MTLPRQELRPKSRNAPPIAAERASPGPDNPAALRVHEQTILGWFLNPANHHQATEHLTDVEVRHFFTPAHQEIYAAIMVHAGTPNIAPLVAVDLAEETAHRSVRDLPGGVTGYLSECREYADCYGTRELDYSVQQVRGAYVRRRRFEIHAMATRALEEDNLDAYDAAQAEMRQLLSGDADQDLAPAERAVEQQRRAIADMAQSRYVALLAEEVVRTRARREAKRIVDAEQADDEPVSEPVKLTDLLGEEDEHESWRIGGLWPSGGNVLLAAGAKSGKTTTTGNVVRSLVDGDRFLGVYDVDRIADGRTVGILDYEMPRRKVKEWLRDQQIQNRDQVMVWTERGLANKFDTRDESARTKWVARLRAADVSVWVIDCLSPILSALGIEENNNTEVGAVLDGINTIAVAAGVDEVLLIHHMGHGAERSRGASRLLGWPDVNWKLVRQRDEKDPTGEPDPNAPRFFSAYGRDVDVREGKLVFEPSSRHLTYVEGGRKQDDLTQNLGRALVAVRDSPRCSGRQVESRLRDLGIGRDPARKALADAVSKGYVMAVDAGGNKTEHSLTQTGRMQLLSMSASPPSDEAIASGEAGLDRVDCPAPDCGYYISGAAWADGARLCGLCAQEQQ